MREPPILAPAIILTQRDSFLFDAALPNGKNVIVHVPKWLRDKVGDISIGAKVELELTPYDFSTARISRHLETPSSPSSPSN